MRIGDLLLVSLLLTAGCASQASMTAKALDCPSREVDIVPSVFTQRGTETAWCATCAGKRYQCATNAERSRTRCTLSKEGDGCL